MVPHAVSVSRDPAAELKLERMTGEVVNHDVHAGARRRAASGGRRSALTAGRPVS